MAGAKSQGDKLVNSGGRVLGVTAVEPTLKEAVAKAYEMVDRVKFDNKYTRRDIGARALKAIEK